MQKKVGKFLSGALEAVWKLAIYCGGARIASLRHDGGKNCVM
ncbi:MAG: hypothetical protein BECKG1743F_GA0114225_104741 [Candidatus Kentron sp. G]|nr:MAG: hypothetical protein BECKG1743F_GA0114225_104741 [Candidatus Kentron sp. G]VFN02171.1 MAG: hypothetical protein BECKG1743E_GA0114224_104801 [Candidatus Kentron sp. G]